MFVLEQAESLVEIGLYLLAFFPDLFAEESFFFDLERNGKHWKTLGDNVKPPILELYVYFEGKCRSLGKPLDSNFVCFSGIRRYSMEGTRV